MTQNIIDAMVARRSVRKFKPDMPGEDAINKVLKAGLYAPSGKNGQDTIFIVVTQKELRDKISRANCKIGGWDEKFDPFYGAPVVIIVLDKADWPTHVYDGSLALGNMMLAADSLGLGSCWIHRAKQEFESDEFKALLPELGIEGEYVGVGHLALGYAVEPVKQDPPERKPNRVFWVK